MIYSAFFANGFYLRLLLILYLTLIVSVCNNRDTYSIAKASDHIGSSENPIYCSSADKIWYSIEIVPGGKLELRADLTKRKINAYYNEEFFDSVRLEKGKSRAICKTLDEIDFSVFINEDYHGKGGLWYHVKIFNTDTLIVNSRLWQSYKTEEHLILWKMLFDTFTKKMKDKAKKKAISIYRKIR